MEFGEREKKRKKQNEHCIISLTKLFYMAFALHFNLATHGVFGVRQTAHSTTCMRQMPIKIVAPTRTEAGRKNRNCLSRVELSERCTTGKRRKEKWTKSKKIQKLCETLKPTCAMATAGDRCITFFRLFVQYLMHITICDGVASPTTLYPSVRHVRQSKNSHHSAATTLRYSTTDSFAIRATTKKNEEELKKKCWRRKMDTELHFEYPEFEILSQTFGSPFTCALLFPLWMVHVRPESNARIHSASALRITFGHWSSKTNSYSIIFFRICCCRGAWVAASFDHSPAFINGQWANTFFFLAIPFSQNDGHSK